MTCGPDRQRLAAFHRNGKPVNFGKSLLKFADKNQSSRQCDSFVDTKSHSRTNSSQKHASRVMLPQFVHELSEIDLGFYQRRIKRQHAPIKRFGLLKSALLVT